MGKFIKLAQQKTFDKNEVGVKVEINGKETWAKCSKAVYTYANKNYKPGDDVTIKYEDGKDLPYITMIKKGSGTDSKGKSEEPKAQGNHCADCGKELKDDKYEKCYTCNKKSPSKSTKKSYNNDTQDSISRQNANHATSRALIALQGHVDPNNVMELIDTLHAKFMEKITG